MTLQMDGRIDGQAESNMPINFFKVAEQKLLHLSFSHALYHVAGNLFIINGPAHEISHQKPAKDQTNLHICPEALLLAHTKLGSR